MADEEEYAEHDFVYCGRRIVNSNTMELSHAIRVVAGSGDNMLEPERLYAGKYDWTIGGVYRGAKFHANGSTVKGLGATKWVRMWRGGSGEEITGWRAMDSAVIEDLRAHKLERDAKKMDPLADAMIDARRSYAAALRRHDYGLVYALERAVVRALKTPPPK